MNELVQYVLLYGLIVVLHCVGLPHPEGVAAVRQHHRHNLVSVVQQVTAVDMSNGNTEQCPGAIDIIK